MDQSEQTARATERARHLANMEIARIQDIEFVKLLHSAVAEQGRRIERLEAALGAWLVALDFDDAATPPMNEQVNSAG